MNIDILADIVNSWSSDSRDGPDRVFARSGWWYRGGPVVDDERFGQRLQADNATCRP